MFERDVFGDNTAWQDVYRSLNQLLEHLCIAMLKRQPWSRQGSTPLLDMQIAQVRLMLQVIMSHRERLNNHNNNDEDAVWFDVVGMLGQLYGPWLGIGQIRQLHTRSLLAYTELLQAYLELLEAARDEEPEPPTSERKKYTII